MSTVLDLGRAAHAGRRWTDAFSHLTDADREAGLPAPDLERLATVAILIGRTTDGVDALIRAHEEYLGVGDVLGAARCAGWIGMHLMNSGDAARSAGWYARAQRLVLQCPESSSVEGFLLIPDALGALYGGDAEGAALTFDRAVVIAERFRDPDLMALARLGQGQANIMSGRTHDGLALLDEVMVAVTAGEISPVLSGIIYCVVIDGCHAAFDLRRAQEWTTALDHWCDAQPDMVPFSGQCQMHRAELYCLHGAWSDAIAAARAARQRGRRGDRSALFGAHYQQGEVQRLRGEFDAAELSYQLANKSGFDPQPGLALLQLARGRTRLAQTLIRRAVDDTDPATRRRRLPALVEIELAAGDVVAARDGADELIMMVRSNPMPMMQAMADYAEGAVLLDEGNAHDALKRLRRGWATWIALDAPYEAARCRVLAGRACHRLEDEDSAAMEFDAARTVFRDLGAGPALIELDALMRKETEDASPLTNREVEVLRLVATGRTNRLVAAELYLSEKTVARHLSNIFGKLGISSRAAATAYAYEHGLNQRQTRTTHNDPHDTRVMLGGPPDAETTTPL